MVDKLKNFLHLFVEYSTLIIHLISFEVISQHLCCKLILSNPLYSSMVFVDLINLFSSFMPISGILIFQYLLAFYYYDDHQQSMDLKMVKIGYLNMLLILKLVVEYKTLQDQ